MSDMESEDDLAKLFGYNEEDEVKPIDMDDDNKKEAVPQDSGAGSEKEPENDKKDNNMPESLSPADGAGPQDPTPDQAPAEAPQEQETKTAGDETDKYLQDALDEKHAMSMEDLESAERNFAEKGDFTEITEKKTNLNHITIGAGWDRTNMEEDPVDLDISLFLLNRDEKTREDEDFIFYNNTNALSGAIRHMGDNRTGAGDGDDETIHIDLNGVPFDIMKIMIVISVYDEDMKGHHLKMAKNIFVRILDTDEKEEIIRFEIPDEELTTATAMRVAALVREGPRWFFSALAEPVIGGLATVATEYDIIVQELGSSGHDDI